MKESERLRRIKIDRLALVLCAISGAVGVILILLFGIRTYPFELLLVVQTTLIATPFGLDVPIWMDNMSGTFYLYLIMFLITIIYFILGLRWFVLNDNDLPDY